MRTYVPNVLQIKRNSSLWDSDICVSCNRNRDKGKRRLFEGNSIAFEIKEKKKLNGNSYQE